MADFTSNLNLELPGFGEREGTWGTVALNQNFLELDGLFGVTTGHTHNGQPGGGGRIEHADLLNSGVLSHAQIEAQLTSLQNQVDENNEIGTVRRLAPDGTSVLTTVLAVDTLDFVNCTVEQTGSGIAKVTPIIPENSSYEVTAPVNHFDAFVGSPGMDLALQSWERITAAENGTFNIQEVGNGLEVRNLDQNWLWQGAANSGVVQAIQAVGYVVSGASPHSEVQRMCAVVEEAEWGEADPNNGEATGFDNSITLRLGILAKKSGVGDGLFLEVRRGSITGVSARFVVSAPGATVTADVLAPGGGLWSGQSYDYFLGQHEVSLSKDSVSGRYWLHYYYNKSLIYKYAEPIGGDSFFDAVADLIANLEATPSEPDFGHFSLTAQAQDFLLHPGGSSLEDVVGRPLNLKIDSVMASSIGERINPKFLDSGFQSESGTVATGAQVCSSFDPNPYAGLQVGETFQPYGGGPQLRVISAGSASFEAQNELTGEVFVFYCDSSGTGSGGGEGSASGETGSSNALNTEGNYVQVGGAGEFAAVTFTADTDVPADWTNGNISGDVIPAGEPLPSTFIDGQAVTVPSGLRYEGAPRFDYTLGYRVPLRTTINATVNPAYDGSTDPLTHTYTDVVEVDVPTPTNFSSKAWYYRNGAWSEITGNNRAQRGDGLALTLTGRNLPLPGFWDAGVGFGKDYRIDSNVNCELSTSLMMFEGGSEYFSSFERGGAATDILGAMPTAIVPYVDPSDPRPTGVPEVAVGSLPNSETVLVVGRLDRCADDAEATLTFTGKGGATTSERIFYAPLQVQALDVGLLVLGTVEEGTTGATVDVLINYPNPNIASQSNVFTSLSGDLTITDVAYTPVADNGPGDVWQVIATLTVTTGADGVATVQYNDGCSSGTLEITITATGVGDPGTPPTPDATIAPTDVPQGGLALLGLSIPGGLNTTITAGDVITIEAEPNSIQMTTITDTFSAADEADGYTADLQVIGTTSLTPTINVSYQRPGASSPQGPTQAIQLNRELPGPLTITGPASLPYPGEGNILEVQLGVTTATPWATPATNSPTITDSSSGGSASLVQVQSLGNNQYGYAFELTGTWLDGETITIDIPNHSVFQAEAGSTSKVIAIDVESSIELVRMGNRLNRFPSTIVVEGATSAQYSGITPEIVDGNGTPLQTLAWDRFQPISRTGYEGNATEEGVIEAVLDLPLSAFGNDVNGSCQPFLRLGTELYSIQRKVQGVFTQSTITYLELPTVLEFELVGSGLGKQSTLNLTEGDEIQVDVTASPLSIIDPEDVGSPHTIEFFWAETSFAVPSTISEVLGQTDPRVRRFDITVGELLPGASAGAIAINLTLQDPTDPAVATQRQRYFPGEINVVKASGGDPSAGGIGAGS